MTHHASRPQASRPGRPTSRPRAGGPLRVLTAAVLLGGSGAQAQENWDGQWQSTGGNQAGRLQFTLSTNGTLSGTVTNGALTGVWGGALLDNGMLVANYTYPGQPPLQAVGVIQHTQGDIVGGYLAFFHNDRLIDTGTFAMRRTNLFPSSNGQYPFTGNGMFVYCAAASVCGQRGLNALPGNFGWTSGLFGDIRRTYPNVWCNLFVNARC